MIISSKALVAVLELKSKDPKDCHFVIWLGARRDWEAYIVKI